MEQQDRIKTAITGAKEKVMKMRKLIGAITVAGSVAIAVSAQAQDIKLGVVAGMSGPGTSYGIGIRQGAEMAVREINAAGGIKGRKISLVVVDDASNPAQSVTAMQRLVNDQVDLVVGGWGSSQVLANMEVADRARLPYIVVGATNPKITTEKNKWTFRVIFTDSVQAEQIADAAVRRLGMKRIAVIHDANDYGAAFQDPRGEPGRSRYLRHDSGGARNHEPGARPGHQGALHWHRWPRQREPDDTLAQSLRGYRPHDLLPRGCRSPGEGMGRPLCEGV